MTKEKKAQITKVLQYAVRHMQDTEQVVILLGGDNPLHISIGAVITITIGRETMREVGIRDNDDVEGSLGKLIAFYTTPPEKYNRLKELW